MIPSAFPARSVTSIFAGEVAAGGGRRSQTLAPYKDRILILVIVLLFCSEMTDTEASMPNNMRPVTLLLQVDRVERRRCSKTTKIKRLGAVWAEHMPASLRALAPPDNGL